MYTLSDFPHAYMFGRVSFFSFESSIVLLACGLGAGAVVAARSVCWRAAARSVCEDTVVRVFFCAG